MEPDFFEFLPAEIMSNILLKLSVRTIAVGKCVCKSWLRFLESDGFIASHFAQSAPTIALAVRTRDSHWLTLFESEQVLDPLTRFCFPYHASIRGSANGLLFMYGLDRGYHLYICNPITREYIKLFRGRLWACGFGVSRISGQHKVVSIEVRYVGGDRRFECHVYTLGTGSWRLVEPIDPFHRCSYPVGAFVHGNLHWMMSDDRDGVEWISCFDLETERFSRFTDVPPLEENIRGRQLYTCRGLDSYVASLFHTPSMVSLRKCFGLVENVISF